MSKGHKLIGGYKSFNATYSTGGVFDIPSINEFSVSDSWGIVRSGLTLNLDALDSQSYPLSGNFWYSVGNLNGTNPRLNLTPGGFTYSSSGFFNVNSDGGGGGTADHSPAFDSFSYEGWIRPTTTHEIDTEATSGASGVAGQKYFIGASQSGENGGAGISCGTNGVSVYEHGNGYMPALLVWSGTVSSTSFTHIVVTYTSKTPRLYVNGTLVKTGLTSLKPRVDQAGYTIGHGSYGFFTGDIAVVRYYNKTLSQPEITQNFNALRGRYGV